MFQIKITITPLTGVSDHLHEQRARAADLANGLSQVAGADAPAPAPAPRPRSGLGSERVADLEAEIIALKRSKAGLQKVGEMLLSEERQAHARTDRLRREAEKNGTHWWRKLGEARQEAAAAHTLASQSKREATAAEQELRRASFQIMSQQRQLSRLSDVVPRAECEAMRARFESTVAEQADEQTETQANRHQAVQLAPALQKWRSVQ